MGLEERTLPIKIKGILKDLNILHRSEGGGGAQKGDREALGGSEGCPGPGQTDRRGSKRGYHKNSLPFVGRVSGKIRLYKEKGEGGGEGGQTERDGEIQDH